MPCAKRAAAEPPATRDWMLLKGSQVGGRVSLQYTYNIAAANTTVTITPSVSEVPSGGLNDYRRTSGSCTAAPFTSSAWLASAKTSAPASRYREKEGMRCSPGSSRC